MANMDIQLDNGWKLVVGEAFVHLVHPALSQAYAFTAITSIKNDTVIGFHYGQPKSVKIYCPLHKPIQKRGLNSMYCEYCDDQLGWYCPTSPDHVCHYKNSNPDQCYFCGDPEERK